MLSLFLNKYFKNRNTDNLQVIFYYSSELSKDPEAQKLAAILLFRFYSLIFQKVLIYKKLSEKSYTDTRGVNQMEICK